MKRCSKCGSVKENNEFSAASGAKDGLQPWCKSCMAKQRKPGVNARETRKGVCLSCGEEFILLSSKRIYCSNNCKSNFNSVSEKRYLWKDENQERSILYRAKASAKRKSIPFNLDLEDIVIPANCPVLGLPLFKGKDNSYNNFPSLDRIKSELGYIKGNVRVISQRANLLKSNATRSELESVLNDLIQLETKTTIIEEIKV